MRKIFLFMNVSLDGFFEDQNHDISGFTNDSEAFSQKPDQGVDTILLGHKTYEMMKYWSTPQAAESMPEIARFFNDNLKVVASHQPFDPGWKNVKVFHEDVAAQVKQLKEQPGKNIIIFGSNNLCVSLNQAGLIDEFQIVVNPVVFGAGTSLFTGLIQKTPLALTATHTFKSGCVMLTYKPVI